MIIDTHQHFWNPNKADYPWMVDTFQPIKRTFTPKDLKPLLSKTGIDYTILVQTRSSTEETMEFLEIAHKTDFIKGVIGWVDLTDKKISTILRNIKSSQFGEKLVGIRHQVHDEENPNWLLNKEVQNGLQAVMNIGLTYDLLVKTRELPSALETVKNFPKLNFVIDHIAKPPIKEGIRKEWAESMELFKNETNVSCKISGMVTEADWKQWKTQQLAPYVDKIIEWFGEERLMFGSDWPVCLLASTYEEVFQTANNLLSNLSASAKEKVFGLNAIKIYKLKI